MAELRSCISSQIQARRPLRISENPQQHYAWIRMPNFKLSDLEAQRLTAFLSLAPAEIAR